MVATPPDAPAPGGVDLAAVFQHAVARQRQGALGEAIDCYQRILSVNPGYAPGASLPVSVACVAASP